MKTGGKKYISIYLLNKRIRKKKKVNKSIMIKKKKPNDKITFQ